MVLREAWQLRVGDRLTLRLSDRVSMAYTVTARSPVYSDSGAWLMFSVAAQSDESPQIVRLRADDLVEIVL